MTLIQFLSYSIWTREKWHGCIHQRAEGEWRSCLEATCVLWSDATWVWVGSSSNLMWSKNEISFPDLYSPSSLYCKISALKWLKMTETALCRIFLSTCVLTLSEMFQEMFWSNYFSNVIPVNVALYLVACESQSRMMKISKHDSLWCSLNFNIILLANIWVNVN